MTGEIFDYKEARRRCMGFGLRVALCWCAAFLCMMAGMRVPLLGNLGLIVGLVSVFVAGRLVRRLNEETGQGSLLRTWWMAMLTYLFATLLTTLVEFLYFRYVDNGQMATMMETVLDTEAYRPLLQGMDEASLRQSVKLMRDARMMAYSFFLMNMTLSLVLSLPTMLLGRARRRKPGEE